MTTPIQSALKEESELNTKLKKGIQAVKSGDKKFIAVNLRTRFSDSIDIDEAFRKTHGKQNRWDYLLGDSRNNKIVGLEPHSATDGEISVVINKRKSCRAQLGPHLKQGSNVSAWFWVASGKIDFTIMDKARLNLDNNGITFVDKQLLPKHLN